MNIFHTNVMKSLRNLTTLQMFQISMALNMVLFVFSIYGYANYATDSASRNSVNARLEMVDASNKGAGQMSVSSVHKDLEDPMIPDDSSRLNDQLEEIEVPKSMKSKKKNNDYQERKEVPSKMTDEKEWSKNFQVPNVVHYVWYTDKPRTLQFHHMLSIISAYKVLSPNFIKFHCNQEPIGEYWNRVISLPRFQIVHRSPPTTLFGEKVKDPVYYTSHSNLDRLKILMEEGGIYLDLDVLVTKSFDDLRHYVCTIGQEQKTKACGSIIVCSNSSVFLRLWINSFLDDYRMEEWAYNTGQVPFNLAMRFPSLVNLEKYRLNRPNFKELDQIWGPKAFSWKDNYAVHIWYRLWKDQSKFYKGVEPNDTNIKTWPGAFGEMSRSILFGSSDKVEE